jgi:hypothetical protein
MSEPNLKQIIQQEYIKCAKDPVHFMKKYCMIQHPQRGRINFIIPFPRKSIKISPRKSLFNYT